MPDQTGRPADQAAEAMTPQQCPKGLHADWATTAETTHACPWCRITELATELAKYIGHEPTIAEELQHLRDCLNAVYDLCDEAEKQATRWEHPLPIPEWVTAVRQAADGDRPATPDDKRRRIYLDGKGNAWIVVGQDPEDGELLAQIDAACLPPEETAHDVRNRTGSLREIGRCW